MSDRKQTVEPRKTSGVVEEEQLPEPFDPLTGSGDFHPAGTTRGALAGGAMGAAIGTGVGGPVGGVVGGVVGAVAGGLTGKRVAAHLDPPRELSYWSAAYQSAEYFDPALDFERDYLPAYRLGWEARSRWAERPFGEIHGELEARWWQVKERSRLRWETAVQAVQDAWLRAEGSGEGTPEPGSVGRR
jgi:hypothetical protein